MIGLLYPATLLHASLSRLNGKEVQLRLCTFARLFVYESHYAKISRFLRLIRVFLLRLLRLPDCQFKFCTVRFIPAGAGTRFLADAFSDCPSKTSSATSRPVFTAFVNRQHLLAIVLKERKHETAKETSQNTSETVPTLKSGTCKNRSLSTVLSRIVLFIQIATCVAAICPALHDDVKTTNGGKRLCAAPYIAKYGCTTRWNSKTANDFPGRNGTGNPVSVMILISTVSKHFFCSGTYST